MSDNDSPNAVRDFLNELLDLPWNTDDPISGTELVSLVAPHVDALREAMKLDKACKRELCGSDHNLAVWYTPDAVRSHAEADDTPETTAQLGAVSDQDLAEAAEAVLVDSDRLWERFADACHSILDMAAEVAKKRTATAAEVAPHVDD